METSTLLNICQIGAYKLSNNCISHAVLKVKIDVHENFQQTPKLLSVSHMFCKKVKYYVKCNSYHPLSDFMRAL